MTSKEAIRVLEDNRPSVIFEDEDAQKRMAELCQAIDMAIEALKNEPILCEDCRHRNTWDNGRLVPQYYRCGRGVKFRDYGYVREDDYCPFGERREE